MALREISLRRWLYLGLVLSTTAAVSTRLWAFLRIDGLTSLELVLLATFTVLFAWTAASFWLACVGLYAEWSRSGAKLAPPSTMPSTARTAVVVPVYNEEVTPVFARL